MCIRVQKSNWNLPATLQISTTVITTGPLNLGNTESHQITSNSANNSSETINLSQPSVKDEFSNSSSTYPTGADYSLQNLDSYYKTNSSATPSESPSSSQQNQENQQPAPTIVKSDTDYSGSVPASSSSTEHVSSHYDYPAYYSTV